MDLSTDQLKGLMATMRAVDNDENSDAMWQAMLENAAYVWGIANGTQVDTYDAFMLYIEINGE